MVKLTVSEETFRLAKKVAEAPRKRMTDEEIRQWATDLARQMVEAEELESELTERSAPP